MNPTAVSDRNRDGLGDDDDGTFAAVDVLFDSPVARYG
jgi:hypothetical protein